MADVTVDLENSNPKELYGQGVRAYVLQDYDTAVKAFSKASEILSEEHNSEIHDSLGDVYLYYGKSLLELSRKESGPLGEGVLKNVEEEEEEQVGEEKNEEEKEEEEENKKEEEEDKKEEEDDKKEEVGESSEAKEEESVEPDDLQVAWEVLELAKKIFTNRGEEGRKHLAETLIVLGEISLESGNFAPAIEDMKQGLEIQKPLFGNDSRTIAETFYKLGGAYATNAQIDEAIDCFNSSYEYLNNKINNLKKNEENNSEEIEELNALTPEIQEKLSDMKLLKVEIAKKVVTSASGEKPSSNGTTEASCSKPANDISHLVKRKRKSNDAVEEAPAKKPSP